MEVTISSTYEISYFWNATTCTQMPANPHVKFNVSANGGVETFGFAFDNSADFDIVYTLTVIRISRDNGLSDDNEPMLIKKSYKSSSRKLLINSVGCIYVVSAAGAAQPDIRANVYNGALCMWSRVPGIGENFLIDYALPY